MEAADAASPGRDGSLALNDLLQDLNRGDIRCRLIGGQAMRLPGMPRCSMDWNLFNHPHDPAAIEFLLELERLGRLT